MGGERREGRMLDRSEGGTRGCEEEVFYDVLLVMMRESERKGVSFAFNFPKMRGD